MNDIIDVLIELKNFNLIKYTGHYVLTIDTGMGKPIIFQSDSLHDVVEQFMQHRAALSGYDL